ncbi:MAG: hypothetical protein ACE5EV_09320 [Gaiellales bacterium]
MTNGSPSSDIGYKGAGARNDKPPIMDYDALRQETVAFAYEIGDPAAYRDHSFLSLYLIDEDAFRRSFARMERNLERDPIPCVSCYLLLWGTASYDT